MSGMVYIIKEAAETQGNGENIIVITSDLNPNQVAKVLL